MRALASSSFVASCLRVKQSTSQRGVGLGFISHEATKTRRRHEEAYFPTCSSADAKVIEMLGIYSHSFASSRESKRRIGFAQRRKGAKRRNGVIYRATLAGAFVLGFYLLSPAYAGKPEDALAMCMWEKMPTTTDAFSKGGKNPDDFELFMKAIAPCDSSKGATTINLKSMKKRLIKIRPATIGSDTSKPANAFICEKGPDGKFQSCRTPGE